MLRTHISASALPLVLLLAGTAACAGAPRPALPAPAPAPVAAADSAPAKVGDDFTIVKSWNGAVGQELLGTATYDLPVEANQWVASEVSFLAYQRHDVVAGWLERGDLYGAFVQATFAAAGIPRDLCHLAMVESGYQPTVRSRAGAVGMWQFMAETGRGMGLRIDDQVDERMDPVRSTRAAARHLRQLWDDFGHDWALAAAAYNAGGGRITRAVQSYGTTSFWELAARGNLAEETRRYVPRLYAVTIIAKDPERFGFAAPAGAREFEFDSVQVDLSTPLPVLARAGNLSLGALADLNPHLYRGVAPPFYWVWVPKGSGAALQQAYRASDFRRRGGYQYYTLRRGENAATVALASDLTVDQLRDLNLGTNVDQLGTGDRVRLYADAARALDARPVERVARRPDDDDAARASRASEGDVSADDGTPRRRSADGGDAGSSRRSLAPRHRAAEDDSSDDDSAGPKQARSERSGRVARALGPDGDPARADSTRRSSDDDDAPRHASSTRGAGDREGTPVSRRSASAENRRSRGDDGGKLAAGTTALTPVIRHTVEDGETVASIARRYGLTAAQLRDANDMSAGEHVRAGQKLRVPRTAAARAESAERHGEPREARSERRPAARGHIVQPGETLYGIARKYDTTVAALRDANDLPASAALQPGQKLRIPRSADASSDER